MTKKTKISVSNLRQKNFVADLICENPGPGAKIRFVVFDGHEQKIQDSIPSSDGATEFIPSYSTYRSDIILPSGTGQPDTAENLYNRISALLSKAIVHPNEEVINFAACWTMGTWLFDSYSHTSYLAFTGSPGTGKSQALTALSKISYTSIMSSGAASEATIYRTLNSIKGTLFVDEAQKCSDKPTSTYHQIFALGTQVDGVIPKCDGNKKTGEWVPKSFEVFGPKATSGRFSSSDEAMLRRFFEIKMPIPNFDKEFLNIFEDKEWLGETEKLRNDLLLYRQRRLTGKLDAPGICTDQKIRALKLSPSERQVYNWLLREVPTEKAFDQLAEAITLQRSENRKQRGFNAEAAILRAAYILIEGKEPEDLTAPVYGKVLKIRSGTKVLLSGICALAKYWNPAPIDTRYVGKVLRNNGLEIRHSADGSCLFASSKQIQQICQDLGLEDPASSLSSSSSEENSDWE